MLIHRTAGIECFFEDRAGEFLLITFNEIGMRANGQRFWGDRLAQKLGVSVAGFVSAEPNWFPCAEMTEVVAALEGALQGRFSERVTYGHSQGGYAAIKLSRAIKATTTIAFCPQYSIDPKDVIDKRFNGFFRPSIHNNMRIAAEDVAGRAFAFYDPHEATDALHAQLISNVVPMTEVRMPFSGHATVRLFAGTEFTAGLFAACRTGDGARLAQLRAAARSRNVQRPYLMALGLASLRPSTAAAIFEAHRAQIPWSRWPSVCYRLAISGKAQQAAQWAEEAAEAEPGNAESRACVALANLEMGRPREALRHIERSLVIRPDDSKYSHIRKRALNALERAPA